MHTMSRLCPGRNTFIKAERTSPTAAVGDKWASRHNNKRLRTVRQAVDGLDRATLKVGAPVVAAAFTEAQSYFTAVCHELRKSVLWLCDAFVQRTCWPRCVAGWPGPALRQGGATSGLSQRYAGASGDRWAILGEIGEGVCGYIGYVSIVCWHVS